MCDGIANGDEAEPVNEGKDIGGGGPDPIASNSIMLQPYIESATHSLIMA